jgi:hypothetical protein
MLRFGVHAARMTPCFQMRTGGAVPSFPLLVHSIIHRPEHGFWGAWAGSLHLKCAQGFEGLSA